MFQKTRTPRTVKNWNLTSPIPEGPINIDEVERLFKIYNLELTIQTFFHDRQVLSAGGNGYQHRVNRKNLPKLTNKMVSSVIIS